MGMLEVTKLQREHLREVAELERLCFAEPWSAHALELLLGEDAVGAVCLFEGRVVAYGGMIYSLDEGQITNIAVHPDARRQGCGRAILHHLLQTAQRREIENVFLEVRVSNVGAIALYEEAGFASVGLRKGFYRSPREDGLVMKKTVNVL